MRHIGRVRQSFNFFCGLRGSFKTGSRRTRAGGSGAWQPDGPGRSVHRLRSRDRGRAAPAFLRLLPRPADTSVHKPTSLIADTLYVARM